MRILANENLPAAAIEALVARGHDVAWVRDCAPGSSDRDVIERARKEHRLIVTFDKDFGELAFRSGISTPGGIILFRLTPRHPSLLVPAIVAALESRQDWSGVFSVIEDAQIRTTPLPKERLLR